MAEWQRITKNNKESRRITTSVKIGNYRIVAVYQPAWRGANAQEVEKCREKLERIVMNILEKEVLIIEDNHNAHVGGGSQTELLNGRCINSLLSNHKKKRGTW